MKEFDSFSLEFDTYHICNDGGDYGAKMQALFKERGQNWQDPEIAKSNIQGRGKRVIHKQAMIRAGRKLGNLQNKKHKETRK